MEILQTGPLCCVHREGLYRDTNEEFRALEGVLFQSVCDDRAGRGHPCLGHSGRLDDAEGPATMDAERPPVPRRGGCSAELHEHAVGGAAMAESTEHESEPKPIEEEPIGHGSRSSGELQLEPRPIEEEPTGHGSRSSEELQLEPSPVEEAPIGHGSRSSDELQSEPKQAIRRRYSTVHVDVT